MLSILILLFAVDPAPPEAEPAPPDDPEAVARLEELGCELWRGGHPHVMLVQVAGKCKGEELKWLAGLPNVETVWMRDPDLTSDDALIHLRALPKLSDLEVPSSITDEGLAQLTGIPTLRVLRLRGANITDAGLVDIARLTSLEFLDVSETKITDAGLEHLRSLEKLDWLIAERTEISDDGLETLAKLKALRILWLERTKITNQGLHHLKTAQKLETLDVTDTGIMELRASDFDGFPKSFKLVAVRDVQMSLSEAEVLEVRGIKVGMDD